MAKLRDAVVSGEQNPPIHDVTLIVRGVVLCEGRLQPAMMVAPVLIIPSLVVRGAEPVTDVIEIGEERLPGQSSDVLPEHRQRADTSGRVDERGPEIAGVLIASMNPPDTERLTWSAARKQRDPIPIAVPRLRL